MVNESEDAVGPEVKEEEGALEDSESMRQPVFRGRRRTDPMFMVRVSLEVID